MDHDTDSLLNLCSFKLSLLASLGLPLACGGEAIKENSGTGGTGGRASSSSSMGSTYGANSFTATTSDVTSTGSGGSGGGVGGAPSFTCSNPQAIEVAGEFSGFVYCDEGYQARTDPPTCPNLLPPKGAGGEAGAANDGCRSHSDCPGELEFCEGGPFDAYCRRGCITDADCPSGTICSCADPIGRCTEGSCASSDDCPGSVCAGTSYTDCDTTLRYSCLSENDECLSDRECNADEQEFCVVTNGWRACGQLAVCGRPFLVRGNERLAAADSRNDWLLGDASPDLAGLTTSERRVLADHWQRIALMEHASIAAFARFSLQLLALGAPSRLIEQTNEALADETLHACSAFSLASSYLGDALGPGPLSTADALEDTSDAGFARTTVLEGCVGETLAALEAELALSRCTDARVRDVLERIARDEARHAALAWRVVAWLLEKKPELRTELEAAFATARLEVAAPPASAPLTLSLTAHGMVSAAERTLLRERALDEVVHPCARALFQNAECEARLALV